MSVNPETLSAKEVEKLHENADTDGGTKSAHHTLGNSANQASPGNHTHNGGNSLLLLEDITITGSRTDGTAVASIIDALEELGALDATTP